MNNNTITQIIHKTKRLRKHIENYAKWVLTWNKNVFQGSSKINAKTGSEKDHEHHQKSCCSDV